MLVGVCSFSPSVFLQFFLSNFAFGALVLGWFVLGLAVGYSYDKQHFVTEGEWAVREKPELTHVGD